MHPRNCFENDAKLNIIMTIYFFVGQEKKKNINLTIIEFKDAEFLLSTITHKEELTIFTPFGEI